MAEEANYIDLFEERGNNRPVKVVNAKGMQKVEEHDSIKGYITLQHYLYGKTSTQIESVLGLPPNMLGGLCYVYRLARFPKPNEIKFRGTTDMPDGEDILSDDPVAKQKWAKFMENRKAWLNGTNLYAFASTNQAASHFPPGTEKCLQWELTQPVPCGGLISFVTKNVPFQRP
ncbi:MAG: hypothetical protein AAGD13_13555 [Pseudomonadota bacterium]